MKLSVAERVNLLSILPAQGDYATLKILNQLRMGLALTEKEFKKWGIVSEPENRRIRWEENGVAEIPIGEFATGIIVDTLRDLEKKKQLNIELLDLYEKFIPTTE
jgi:hypothetical protein